MNWFLYDKDFRHEGGKSQCAHLILQFQWIIQKETDIVGYAIMSAKCTSHLSRLISHLYLKKDLDQRGKGVAKPLLRMFSWFLLVLTELVFFPVLEDLNNFEIIWLIF